MKQYEITFGKNEIYHANIVLSDKSPVEIGLHYKEKGYNVFDIRLSTARPKPGQPVIEI